MKSTFFSLAALVLLSTACDKMSGPKGKVELKDVRDSLSYGIGTQIGGDTRMRLHRAEVDSLNMDMLRAGFAAGLDSTVDSLMQEKLIAAVGGYFKRKRDAQIAEENAKAEENLKKATDWLAENGRKPGITTTPSGLQYEVLKMGSGPKPTMQDAVDAHYRGTLMDGKEFQSSYKNGQPAHFGLNEVIPGWVEALQLMPEGSKFRVYIPPALGYGAQAQGEMIPGNSVLIFDLELLKVDKGGAAAAQAAH